MPAYIVQAAHPHHVSSGNVRLVNAASAAAAREIAACFRSGERGQWPASTVTEIAAPADFAGWTFRVVVNSPAGVDVADVTHTGIASDGLDEVGDALVILLNATASIANAAYVGATQTLTIASGAGGDDLGDHAVTLEFKPPAATHGDPQHIASLVSTLTDGGLATAALTLVMVADTVTVPSVVASVEIAD